MLSCEWRFAWFWACIELLREDGCVGRREGNTEKSLWALICMGCAARGV